MTERKDESIIFWIRSLDFGGHHAMTIRCIAYCTKLKHACPI